MGRSFERVSEILETDLLEKAVQEAALEASDYEEDASDYQEDGEADDYQQGETNETDDPNETHQDEEDSEYQDDEADDYYQGETNVTDVDPNETEENPDNESEAEEVTDDDPNETQENSDNEEVEVEICYSDGSMSTVDLKEGDPDLKKEKTEKKQETSGNFFTSLFGKRKRQESENNNQEKESDEEQYAERAPSSDVFRQLKRMQESSGTQDETSTPNNAPTNQFGTTVDNKTRDVEQGITEEDAPERKAMRLGKTSKLILVGIAIFLLFDVALLVVFLLGR
jgi:hypothetical protein